MISCDDVVYRNREMAKLVSIDSCIVFANGNAAITTFKVDLCFSYKTTMNEDRAMISITWNYDQTQAKWKILHFQRATGQPIPKDDE